MDPHVVTLRFTDDEIGAIESELAKFTYQPPLGRFCRDAVLRAIGFTADTSPRRRRRIRAVG